MRSRLDPSGISVWGEKCVFLLTALLKVLRTVDQSRSLSNALTKEVRCRHNGSYKWNKHGECCVCLWKEEDTSLSPRQIPQLETQVLHVELEAQRIYNQLGRCTASGTRTQIDMVRSWTQEQMIEVTVVSTPRQSQEPWVRLATANRRQMWGDLFQTRSRTLESSDLSMSE